jgi:DNA-binding IclR family transcriptional regulator
MKTLTRNQKRVLAFLQNHEDAYTVAEIAAAYYAPPASIRGALQSLQRLGLVEVKGSALTGGQTWGVKA